MKNSHYTKVVIFFIASLFFIGCIRATHYADPGEGYPLEYKLKEGDVLKYDTCIMGKETYRKGDKEKSVNVIEEASIKFEVASVDKDGKIVGKE